MVLPSGQLSDDERYVRELEETIAKFMSPLRDIPFAVVMKAISGFAVLPFDRKNPSDASLLTRLTSGLDKATAEANREGIFTNRPNEVGNHIEPFVKNALNQVKCRATVPRTKKGIHRSAGYPDIEIRDIDGRLSYLECKTYNIRSEDSSFRAFYLQPSEDVKITADARHLLVGFEIESATRRSKAAYVPTKWRLYTLENLQVQVKHEFNASNIDIYRDDSLLARGSI